MTNHAARSSHAGFVISCVPLILRSTGHAATPPAPLPPAGRSAPVDHSIPSMASHDRRASLARSSPSFHAPGGCQSATLHGSPCLRRSCARASCAHGIVPKSCGASCPAGHTSSRCARSASSRRMRRPSWPPCSVENRTQCPILALTPEKRCPINHTPRSLQRWAEFGRS